MRNHRYLTNLALQGESGRTVVGLFRARGIVVPADGLT
jgi:hypothetical protein